MLNLVHIRNSQAVTSSRTVAEIFGKYHKDVLEQIQGILTSAENSAGIDSWFSEDLAPDSQGKLRKVYYMNRDGFVLLAMGFTGKKALHFKIAYIKAFDAMEEELNHRAERLEFDQNRFILAIKFAEELSKHLLWFTGSEIEAKRLAIECAAEKFDLDLEQFSFMLSKFTENEIFNVTEIGRILGLEANDVNRILRKMKFQRQFRNRWLPIGEGLKFAVIEPYTKWKAAVIEPIKKFLQERFDG